MYKQIFQVVLSFVLASSMFAGAFAQTPELSISPDTTVVGEGNNFTVNVELKTGTQQVDGFFVELSFDATKMQVVSTSEQATAEFPVNLIAPTVDNSAGTIRYSRGTFSNFPSDSLRLLTIEFSAIADTTLTPISFVGFTDVTFLGNSVLNSTVDGQVEILDIANLTINYTLQGRTDFAGDENGNFFTVELYQPGTTNLLFSFPGLIGTSGGQLNIAGVIAQEVDVWVKHTKYLARLGNTTLVGGANSVNAGELRAGDANNDNLVLLTDFSILSTTFGLAQGDLGYNEDADFNGDGSVVLVDFSLLVTNFNTAGSNPGDAPVFRLAPSIVEIKNKANLSFEFEKEYAQAGEFVVASLYGNSAAQELDGVEAHMNFNPSVMEVIDIQMANSFDIELAKSFDNEAGFIDLAAGSLSGFPAGKVEVATVVFRVKAEGDAKIEFVQRGHLKSDATYGGQSIFGGASVDAFAVSSPTSVKLDNGFGLKVYPSPAKDLITVKLESSQASASYILRVFNMAGQLMIERQLGAFAEESINLNSFSEGIYRVQLTDGKQTTYRNFSVER